jgi:cytochrome b involved in lipid metabolism
MKKYTTISLFIFFAIVVSVITAGLIVTNNNSSQVDSTSTNTTPSTLNSTTSPVKNVSTTTPSLTMSELAKHNSSKNCWLLISGKIYDVTSFINQHPGGANEILKNCGTDATVAFATRGGTGTHSARAYSMLSKYFIGNLN